jgi:hypothetical protein
MDAKCLCNAGRWWFRRRQQTRGSLCSYRDQGRRTAKKRKSTTETRELDQTQKLL